MELISASNDTKPRQHTLSWPRARHMNILHNCTSSPKSLVAEALNSGAAEESVNPVRQKVMWHKTTTHDEKPDGTHPLYVCLSALPCRANSRIEGSVADQSH